MRGQTLKVSERQTLDHTGDGRSVFGLLFGTDWAPDDFRVALLRSPSS